MTHRISDERLAASIGHYKALGPPYHEALAVREELQQSRDIITQLRALAEEMREYCQLTNPTSTLLSAGRVQAMADWLHYIDAMLSAHDGAAPAAGAKT